ncbi:MAG TPA: chromate efflux transporter [Longimicrobiales bacterium]|nr:chromate efflux transporter [Longimicrobiales bacterium]
MTARGGVERTREGSTSEPGLGELFAVFLRLALLGFGGPNAHLALMLEEVVEKRGWLTREEFLELMAVTNLLPGPNSSEMAIHVGYATRGVPGALITGLTFLMPAFLMVTGLSALYFSYGALPAVDPVLATIKPVVLAIILRAGVKLARTAVVGGLEVALAVVGVAIAVLYGGWVVPAMLLGGVVTWAAWRSGEPRDAVGVAIPLPLLAMAQSGAASVLAALPAWALVALVHLGIGAVLFGGGYTLVVLLQPVAVEQYGWLTAGQFLDGVAITQAVPGPISTLAAFVGFAAAGVSGATLATAGIYLPAFAAVLFVAPRFARLREVAGIKAGLRGVSAVVAGSLLGVALTLVPPAIPDMVAGVIFAVAGVALLSGKAGPLPLVLVGLVVGVVRGVVG